MAGFLAHASDAPAGSVSACLARKLRVVGWAVTTRTACYAKHAAKPNAEALAACLAKASDRLTGDAAPDAGPFQRLERTRPCLTTGDQDAVDGAVAIYTGVLDAQVGNPGTASACDAAKLRCVGRYVAGVLKCHARAAMHDGLVDDDCLLQRRLRLSDGVRGCLDKAEVRGQACSVSGDAAALEFAADHFVATMLCTLDPAGAAGCPGRPTPPTPVVRTPTPTRTASPRPSPTATSAAPGDVAQLCVDRINAFRASIGRPPYARWTAAETCADAQARADGQSGTAHGAFGQCGEWAQNECPGWPGPPATMIVSCLQMMWNEGPGEDFSRHGHYINMASTHYTKVACGFAVRPNGSVWAVQDFQ